MGQRAAGSKGDPRQHLRRGLHAPHRPLGPLGAEHGVGKGVPVHRMEPPTRRGGKYPCAVVRCLGLPPQQRPGVVVGDDEEEIFPGGVLVDSKTELDIAEDRRRARQRQALRGWVARGPPQLHAGLLGHHELWGVLFAAHELACHSAVDAGGRMQGAEVVAGRICTIQVVKL